MIVDAHTHVTTDGQWFSTSFDASETCLLRQMDEEGVEKAVVIGLPGYISNESINDLCERHSGRLLPVASFNPADYANSQEVSREIRKQLKDEGFIGVKLHPRLNHYDPLDARMFALLDEIASWPKPLPVWIDTLFYYPGGVLKKPPVETIHEMVGSYPGITFFLSHAGGADILRLSQAVRSCPNTYLELSLTLTRYLGSSVEMDIRYLLRTFEQRLVFGSDFPEVSLSQAKNVFDMLLKGAKPGASDLVLGGNFCKLILQGANA